MPQSECDKGSKGLVLIQLIIDYGTSRGSGLSSLSYSRRVIRLAYIQLVWCP